MPFYCKKEKGRLNFCFFCSFFPVRESPVPGSAQQKVMTAPLPSTGTPSPRGVHLTRGPAVSVATLPASAPRAAGPKKEFAIALFDNEVDDDEELAFTAGDRIEVIEKDDSGWYKGRLNGREGLFPVNYVKLE